MTLYELAAELFTELLSRGLVQISFDPYDEDCEVPDHLRDGEGLKIFDYGYDLPMPTLDVKVDEEGISATLSFNRKPTYTFVPWSAVQGFASESGSLALRQRPERPFAKGPPPLKVVK